jgi:hypothetical protein
MDIRHTKAAIGGMTHLSQPDLTASTTEDSLQQDADSFISDVKHLNGLRPSLGLFGPLAWRGGIHSSIHYV